MRRSAIDALTASTLQTIASPLEQRNSFAVAQESFARAIDVSNDVDLNATCLRWKSMSLLKWALIFLVISLVAALFGFTGISAASADIARVLFYIFVIIFLVLLVLGLTIFRSVSGP